jgi:cytochrome c1
MVFAGPFGKYDQAQLQRGFKIYKEVCSACHSIQMLALRTWLMRGAGFSAQAAAVAAEYKIKDLDDKGEAVERAAGSPITSSPFANEFAAKAATRRCAARHVDAGQGAHLEPPPGRVRRDYAHQEQGPTISRF